MKNFQAMRCPKCSSTLSKVVDKRNHFSQVRRRRECLECRCRFTTRERVDQK